MTNKAVISTNSDYNKYEAKPFLSCSIKTTSMRSWSKLGSQLVIQ